MCCVSLNLPILYFVDYLGVTGSDTKRRELVVTEKQIKKITGLQINKELSLVRSDDRRVKGFDSPFSSKI
jgi:hypothetical protein